MTVERLLAQLRRRGVTFAIVDNRVKVTGWLKLSAAERDQLRATKAAVMQTLERKARRRATAQARKAAKAALAVADTEGEVIGQRVTFGCDGDRSYELLYRTKAAPLPRETLRRWWLELTAARGIGLWWP